MEFDGNNLYIEKVSSTVFNFVVIDEVKDKESLKKFATLVKVDLEDYSEKEILSFIKPFYTMKELEYNVIDLAKKMDEDLKNQIISQ